jgi:hypothetical protein
LTYLDLVLAEKNHECPKGFLNSGVANYYENSLCIPKKYECPLNQVDFLNAFDLKHSQAERLKNESGNLESKEKIKKENGYSSKQENKNKIKVDVKHNQLYYK